MLKKNYHFFIIICLVATMVAAFSMVASAAVDSNLIHYTAIYTNGELSNDGGAVSPDGIFKLSEKLEDNRLTFTITPNDGFVLSQLKYNNEVVIPSGNNPHTFMLDAASMNGVSLSKLDVFFETEKITPPSVSTYVFGYKSILKDTVTFEGDNPQIYNRITLFGILNPNGYTSFKYGILFKQADSSYESSASANMTVGAPGVVKYPAQAQYVLPYYLYGVSLCGASLNEGMFYVRPYVEYTIGNETSYSYGNVVNTILLNPQPKVEPISISGAPLTNTVDTTSTTNSSDTTESTITDANISNDTTNPGGVQ